MTTVNNTETRSLLLRQQQENLRQEASSNQNAVQQNSSDQQANGQAVQTNTQAQQGNASDVQTTTGNIQTTTQNIDAANAQKSGVNTEISSLQTELQSVQDDPDRAAAIQNDISAAEMSLSSLDAEIQQLETQKGQQEQELTGLEQTGAQLRTEGQTLEQEGAALQQTGTELAQTEAELEAQISDLDSQIVQAEAEEQDVVEPEGDPEGGSEVDHEQDFTDSKVNFGDTFNKLAEKQLAALKQTNPNATLDEAKEILFQLNPEVFDRNNPGKIRLNAEFTYSGNVDVSDNPSVEENNAKYSNLMKEKAAEKAQKAEEAKAAAEAKAAEKAKKSQAAQGAGKKANVPTEQEREQAAEDAYRKDLVRIIQQNAGVFDKGSSDLRSEKGAHPSGAAVDAAVNRRMQDAVRGLDGNSSLEDIAYAVRLASGGQRFASESRGGGSLSVNVTAQDLSKLFDDMKTLQQNPSNKKLAASVNKRLNDFTLGSFTHKYIANGHELNKFSGVVQDFMTDAVMFAGGGAMGGIAEGLGGAGEAADLIGNTVAAAISVGYSNATSKDHSFKAQVKYVISAVLPFSSSVSSAAIDDISKALNKYGSKAKEYGDALIRNLSSLNKQQQAQLQKALKGKSSTEQAAILMSYGGFRAR